MKARVIVAVIIRRGDKFLLGKKPKNIGPYPNTWHLLGGGVKLKKESVEDAARREIKEEAGVEVGILKRVSFDDGYEPGKKGEMTHYVFLVYEAEYKSGQIKAADDIEELKWFRKSELKNISLPRPTMKLLKDLRLI